MHRRLYTLDPSGKIMHEPSEDRWREWFADPAKRIVASTQLARATVETAFMGLDLREFGMWTAPVPLFFATRVRAHDGKSLQNQFTDTLLSAVAEHEALVSHLLRGNDDQ